MTNFPAYAFAEIITLLVYKYKEFCTEHEFVTLVLHILTIASPLSMSILQGQEQYEC